MTRARGVAVCISLLFVVLVATPASAGAPAGAPCGFTASVPGGDGPDGYALRAGYTHMDSGYTYRVVAGAPSWFEGEVDYAIGQANAATHAHLTHGPDVQYAGDLSLMNAGDHEIWVFANTQATRGARPPGTWTYTNVSAGRTINGWISLDPNLPASTRRKSLLHELGHSLGLDHYFWPFNGQCQIMSYGESNLTTYRAGDLAGLRALAGLAPSAPATPRPALPPRPKPIPATKAPAPELPPKIEGNTFPPGRRAEAVLMALRHLQT